MSARYSIRYETGDIDEIERDSVADARAEARRRAAVGYDDDRASTIWVDVWVAPLDDDGDPGDEYRLTVRVDPPEPACEGDEHHWAAPHALVGGLEENPGVMGHGGGVVQTEICLLCGISRITDSWAQRPDTGEQGLESVEYRIPDGADMAALVEYWTSTHRDTIVAAVEEAYAAADDDAVAGPPTGVLDNVLVVGAGVAREIRHALEMVARDAWRRAHASRVQS